MIPPNDPALPIDTLDALLVRAAEECPGHDEEVAAIREALRILSMMQTTVAAMVAANIGAEAVKTYAIEQTMLAAHVIHEWQREHEPATAAKMH